MTSRDRHLTGIRFIALGFATGQLAVVGYAIPYTFGHSVGTGIAAAVARLGLPVGFALVALGMRKAEKGAADE